MSNKCRHWIARLSACLLVSWISDQAIKLCYSLLFIMPRRGRRKRKLQLKSCQVTKESSKPHSTAAVDTKQQHSAPEVVSNNGALQFASHFENLGSIGQGFFGTVYKAKHHLDDQIYAVKKIRIRAKKTKKIIGEAKSLTKLNHGNVVRYHNSWIEYSSCDDKSETEETNTFSSGDKNDTADAKSESEEKETDTKGSSIVFADDTGEEVDTTGINPPDKQPGATNSQPPPTAPKFLYIQMEYCGKDTLRTYINKEQCQQQECRQKIFTKILDGLEYIHNKAIIHRDLKPENIFVDRDGEEVKIGDFGLATRINLMETEQNDKTSGTVELTTNIGSRMYRSPEMLSKGRSKTSYGKEVDIYSLGVIFFEMCYKPPQTGMERVEILNRIRSKEIRFPDDFDYRRLGEESFLIRTMLTHIPQLRPSIKDLRAAQPQLKPRDICSALINSIMNPSCLRKPTVKRLRDIEDTFVKHCQVVSAGKVTSFKDVVGIPLVEFLKERSDLYHLSTDKVTMMQF